MQHQKRQQRKQHKRLYDLLISTEGVCSGLLCLCVVALVAPIDQLSPGAGLVVSHHLTIVLLMKTLILTLGGTRVQRPTRGGGGGEEMEPPERF